VGKVPHPDLFAFWVMKKTWAHQWEIVGVQLGLLMGLVGKKS
jgi:hypothetical protein